MSGYAYQWAKEQRVGDCHSKSLLKTYAHWASEDYSTWVTNERLLADLEMDIKTLRKSRDKLIALGFLLPTTKRRGDTGGVVVYQMIAPPGSTVVQAVNPRTNETVSLSPPSLEEYEAKGAQKRSPSKSGPLKGDQKRTPSTFGPLKGDQKRTPSTFGPPPDVVDNPSTFTSKPLHISLLTPPNLDPDKGLEGLESSESGDAHGKTAHTPNVEKQNLEPATSGFERFWDTWPSATGRKQAKSICQSHWEANGLEPDSELIVMHVEAMKRTPHWKTGGDPTPIRYLEQRRWRDGEPEPAPQASSAPEFDGPWWEASVEVIDARGAELGVRPRKTDETIAWYRVLVVKASREKAAVDFVLKDARRFNSQALFEFAVATFGDALMPTDFYAS